MRACSRRDRGPSRSATLTLTDKKGLGYFLPFRGLCVPWEGQPGASAVGKDAAHGCERAAREFTESLGMHAHVSATAEGQAWARGEDGCLPGL